MIFDDTQIRPYIVNNTGAVSFIGWGMPNGTMQKIGFFIYPLDRDERLHTSFLKKMPWIKVMTADR